MLDFPGGILCGQKGDSDPIQVEQVWWWPRSGRQSEASEPGRMLNTKLGGQGSGGASARPASGEQGENEGNERFQEYVGACSEE